MKITKITPYLISAPSPFLATAEDTRRWPRTESISLWR